ncbi:tape measure protein [Auritidibacter ignavus]|uniref:aggregation-promoting factor C-terminal-like domain-containing protein n=1 Tax=Auritidibacter ignavus TaxID=678932 RepID=UPI002449B2ED|nr:tape measure protein [Auritidibacter ignavus]WGH91451.1 tape measure protein [Auritidibacter ignavus]
MALTAAELVAYLRMDKTDFDSKLGSAEKNMRTTSGKFRDWAKDMGGAMAGTLTVAGTAAGALAVAVGKTGVEYNGMQQASRAALDTIMGGAEKANAQMDKLDEFARNSPFAKDVFINAQQQLLGFGVEADKVIPALESIQDSVAAVGGSNEDIASITDTLSKMQGQGKLTGETLNRLGEYGIDAATILGEQMGKTGEEIRAMASKPGGIPVDKVWDPLVEGLTDRFGGAAANVKNTWAGAIDRIKAATRDIGSEVAKPLVDPKGGGYAVTWANQFADVLRAVQRQVEPLTSLMEGRFQGAIGKVSEVLLDARDAIDSITVDDLNNGLETLGRHAPAIAGVGTAITLMASKNIPIIGGLASALGPIPGALIAAATASPEARDALGQLFEAVAPLGDTLLNLAGILSDNFTTAIGIAADVLGVGVSAVKPLIDAFTALPEPVQNSVIWLGALVALRGKVEAFGVLMGRTGRAVRDGSVVAVDGVRGIFDVFRGWRGAFDQAYSDTGRFRSGLFEMAGQVGRDAKSGLRGVFGGVMSLLGGPWGVALGAAGIALTLWSQKNQEAKQRQEEFKASLDETTGALTEQSTALIYENVSANERAMDALEAYGLTVQDVIPYIEGQAGAEAELKSRVEDLMKARWEEQGLTEKEIERRFEQAGGVEAVLGPLEKYKEETREATEAKRDELDAQQAAAESLDETERALDRYSEQMAIVNDETKTGTDRARALKEAIDELSGVELSADEIRRQTETSTRNITEQLKAYVDATNEQGEALVNLKEGQLAYNDEGDRLNELLVRHEELARESAIAAYDKAGGDQNAKEAAEAAADAYAKQRDKLEEQMIQAGFSREEVEKLTDKLFAVPSDVQYHLTDGGSIDVQDAKLYSLAKRIDATPDKTITIDEPKSPGIIQRLKALGYKVDTLPDGKIRITETGSASVENTLDYLTKDRTVDIKYRPVIDGEIPFAPGVKKTRRGGPLAEALGLGGRHAGGIDVHGMATGAITGNNVMNVAQMVKPGDIRFAGDRSDVDEAWIPLDGSKRSVAILLEAMRRMPGFTPEGMASGSVTARVTPATVDGVQAPDTSELTGAWVEAMDQLTGSTESAFTTMADDTATAHQAMTGTVSTAGKTMTADTRATMLAQQSATLAGNRAMTADTRATMLAQQSATLAGNRAMTADTKNAVLAQQSATITAHNVMSSDTAKTVASLVNSTVAGNRSMTADTRSQKGEQSRVTSTANRVMLDNTVRSLTTMRDTAGNRLAGMTRVTGQNMAIMRTTTATQVAGMRERAGEEFTRMRDRGVATTAQLRDGVVNQMGSARQPFTGKINDLIGVLRSFSNAISQAYGDMGVSMKKPVRLATGGVLPGYTPGRDVHSFTSPTGGRLELSGGESIMRPEVARAMGRGWVDRVNTAARGGGVTGVRRVLGDGVQAFADGGIFETEFSADAKKIGQEYKGRLPVSPWRPIGEHVIQQVIDGFGDYLASLFDAVAGPGMVVTNGRTAKPTTGRVTSGYGPRWGGHHAGMDIAAGQGTPTFSYAAGVVRKTGPNIGPGRTGLGILIEHANRMHTYYGHNPIGGVRVRAGDKVLPGQRIGAQGTTGNVTGAHLHWEVHRKRAWGDVNPAKYWATAGRGGNMTGTIPGSTGGTDFPAGSGSIKDQVRAVAARYGWGSGAQWRAVDQLLSRESGWNHRAANPTSSAEGLFQKMTSIHGPVEPTAAGQAEWGFNYIKRTYGNPLSALAHHNRRGWYADGGVLPMRGYADGTSSAVPGWAWVGERGPELLKFRGGETVKTAQQSARQQVSVQGVLSERDADLLGRSIAKHMDGGVTFNAPVTAGDTDRLAERLTALSRRRRVIMAR